MRRVRRRRLAWRVPQPVRLAKPSDQRWFVVVDAYILLCCGACGTIYIDPCPHPSSAQNAELPLDQNITGRIACLGELDDAGIAKLDALAVRVIGEHVAHLPRAGDADAKVTRVFNGAIWKIPKIQ